MLCSLFCVLSVGSSGSSVVFTTAVETNFLKKKLSRQRPGRHHFPESSSSGTSCDLRVSFTFRNCAVAAGPVVDVLFNFHQPEF